MKTYNVKKDRLASAVKTILTELGENPAREGLVKTPARVAKALRELTSGYKADPDAIINGAFYKAAGHDMVTITGITFYSMCEHHMLPFSGRAHVAYIPNGRIVGLSKIPRLVRAFSSRLQVQERLTRQIAEMIREKLDPLGVAVVLEARHMCVEMRGARSERANCVTSTFLGAFESDDALRAEFYRTLRRQESI